MSHRLPPELRATLTRPTPGDLSPAWADWRLIFHRGDHGNVEFLTDAERSQLAGLLADSLDPDYPKVHILMAEHDGYAPHSHEVRPDHRGVNRRTFDPDAPRCDAPHCSGPPHRLCGDCTTSPCPAHPGRA